MKILISGGAGYIGSVTSEVLLQAGHEVWIIDNLEHGHRSAVPGRAHFQEGDLSNLAAIRATVESIKPDAVLHFAGHIQVGESMKEPFKYLRDNVTVGLNLMQASVESGVRKFILSSTAALFDLPDRIPIDEGCRIIPGSPYGEGKLYLERVLQWVEKTHGLRWASLRYFNASGATVERGEDHDPETHLIPIVLEAAMGKREHVPVFGTDYETPDGTCVRDYIHVEDLAIAHQMVLPILESRSSAYNLGNGNGFSVVQVIDAARKVTGRSIAVEKKPRRPGDVAKLVADSRLIRRELGWAPRWTSIEGIVESAWKWMLKNPDGYRD